MRDRRVWESLRRSAGAAVVGIVLVSAGLPARAELPPLVPRSVLFGEPERDWPQISPDGTRLAYLAANDSGVVNIWVRTLGQQDDRMVTRSERDDLGVFAWAWDGKRLLYFDDHHGDENLHLWSIDIETGRQRDLTPFVGARATNLATSAARPTEVLVGINLRDPRTFDMYRVDLDTGAVVLDTENPGDVLSWTTDAAFEIRAASAFDPKDGTSVVRVRDRRDAPWRDLVRTAFEETPLIGQANGGSTVVAFAPDGRSLYMGTWHGSETTRLVQVDCATGAELATVAHDPKSDLFTNLRPDGSARFESLQEPTTGALHAVAFGEDKLKWRAIDPRAQADLDVLGRAAAPGVFFVQSQDRSDRKWVVAMLRPDGPQRNYLYDRDTRKLEFLFADRPALARHTLAAMEFVRIRARDGLSLPAYLTLPAGVPRRALPLVLFVHGGPWFRDNWFYDPTVQLLANRGCAVLQVQFRGSIGFGRTHLNASTREWGGKMQDDLTDAVQWAIRERIADPKRVAIMGGSYGGYATLAGLAFTPELYACGVDIVGPSNVATALAAFPSWWAPVKKRWVLRVGDAENDAEFNRRISPVFHADRMRAPLLIGHGANDPRVKQSESDAIVAALRAHDIAVEYVVYPDEGHGFGRTENALDFTARMEDFLARHLGIRHEPRTAIAGTSAEER